MLRRSFDVVKDRDEGGDSIIVEGSFRGLSADVAYFSSLDFSPFLCQDIHFLL
jgi:hypothetical protein